MKSDRSAAPVAEAVRMGDGMNANHRSHRSAPLVFGVLVVLSLASILGARHQASEAVWTQMAQAEQRALDDTNTVLYNALTASTVETPLTGATYRELYTEIQGQVLTDPRVARVRLWGAEGVLLFSTDPREQLDGLRISQDPAIVSATNGEVSSHLTTSRLTVATSGELGTPTDLLMTFAPLRVPDRISVAGAVQIDQYYDTLRAAAREPWRTAQASFLGLALVFTACGLWSLRRRPSARVPDAIEDIGSVPGVELGEIGLPAQLREAAAARQAATRAVADADRRARELELQLAIARRDAEEAAAEAFESRTARLTEGLDEDPGSALSPQARALRARLERSAAGEEDGI